MFRHEMMIDETRNQAFPQNADCPDDSIPASATLAFEACLKPVQSKCPLSGKVAASQTDSSNINHAIEAAWPEAALLRSWQVLAARLPWT